MASRQCAEVPRWVDLAVAEYNAHRAQVLSLLQAGQQTLTFGATAVGIIIAAALNLWNERLLVAVVFLAVIPLLSVIVVVQWVGQTIALARVGVYLLGLEKALRTVHAPVPTPVLTWEEGLRAMTSITWWKPDWRWYASAAITAFGLLTLGSILLGTYRAYAGHEVLVLSLAITECVVLAGLAGLLAYNATTSWDMAQDSSASARAAEQHRS